MSTKRIFSLLSGLLLLIALAACSPAEPVGVENQLVGTNWTVVSMDGTEVGSAMTLDFADDTVSGSDGCNTFTGSYTIADDVLVIADNLLSTAMACPDRDEAISRQYLDALLSISNFTFDNDSLTIQTERGELVFARTAEGNDPIESEIDTMVNQLVTTNWELVSMNGAKFDDGKTLSFGSDTISGSDGCNTFTSSYTIGNGTLNIDDNIASTMMACPGMDAEAAQQYLSALVSASTFTQDGGSLTIQTKNGVLVFTPISNAALEGTRWQLNSLADNDGNITRMPIDSQIFIMFDADQVNGSGGCNSFNGSVTVDATQMSFGNIASTLMACADPEVSQRETEFYAAFANVATYEIVAQTLTLYAADGETIATFVATEELVKSDKLMNTVWQWVRFEDTAELNDIDVDSPASYTIQFLTDGTYVLQADCNRGSGSYTLDTSGLTIEPGALTLAECGDESLGSEFVRLLGDVVTYVFDGDGNLVMNLIVDAGNMVFIAAE